MSEEMQKIRNRVGALLIEAGILAIDCKLSEQATNEILRHVNEAVKLVIDRPGAISSLLAGETKP